MKNTGNRKKILNFTREFVKNNHYSPSIREICEGTGISSTSSVHYNIAKLAIDGKLTRGSEPRTINVGGIKVLEEAELEILIAETFRRSQKRLCEELVKCYELGLDDEVKKTCYDLAGITKGEVKE